MVSSPGHAYDFDRCVGCHEVTLEADLYRRYQHTPFLEKKCAECHTAEESEAISRTSPKSLPQALLKERKKIKWLIESSQADTRHSFILPRGELQEVLVVEARDGGGLVSRQDIVIPSKKNIPAVKDNGQDPTITDVQVLGVKRGVFLSATIGWKTDELTEGFVRYGEETLSHETKPGNRFAKRHIVELYNLKPDRTYRFSVVVQDLFGRHQTSESSTLSTAKSFEMSPGSLNGSDLQNSGTLPSSSFKGYGEDYLYEITFENPSAVFIGTREMVEGEGGVSSETGGDEKIHAGLSSERAVSLDSCGKCHKGSATATHPVNVFPKPGMRIPPEYPTLPDGRITCGTCHNTHSSEFDFLARKPSRRELCTGCHKDMI